MNKYELLKKAKPILFNTEMVRAILDGRKTQTRRVFSFEWLPHERKIMPEGFERYADTHIEKSKQGLWRGFYTVGGLTKGIGKFIKPKYKTGDILYVRETWCIGTKEEDDSPYKEYWYIGQYKDSKSVFYKASLDDQYSDEDCECKWKPSIHMPKKYARIFLKVTNVRVERLKDIKGSDILSEGVSKYKNYNDFRNDNSPHDTKVFVGAIKKIEKDWINLWNSTAPEGYRWGNNPYVFVYEFEKMERNNVQ